jgi:hypothetical protein
MTRPVPLERRLEDVPRLQVVEPRVAGAARKRQREREKGTRADECVSLFIGRRLSHRTVAGVSPLTADPCRGLAKGEGAHGAGRMLLAVIGYPIVQGAVVESVIHAAES